MLMGTLFCKVRCWALTWGIGRKVQRQAEPPGLPERAAGGRAELCEMLHAWEHRRAISYLMLSLPLQAQEKTGNRQVKRGQGGGSLCSVHKELGRTRAKSACL